MKTYLYPQNLKAKANLWLWSLRDFVILCAAVLVSAVIFLNSGFALPAALALLPGMIAPLTAQDAPRRKGLALAWAAAASLGLWRFLCYTGSAAAPACMPLALFGAAAWLGPWLCGTVRERCISLAVAVAGAVAACLALSPPALPGAFSLLAGVALALAYSRLLSRRAG